MIIKTITCHDVYNYGASLQAYALMHYLETEGHNIEIIDYLPDYLRHHYDFWYIPEDNRFHGICQKSRLLHLLYCIRLLPVTYRTWRRIKPFKKFKTDFLHCTKQYSSYEALVSDPPKADCYVAGSDQIWNCLVHNGNDPAFYLNFGPERVKRISYAASFAISDIPIQKQATIKRYLKVFNAISVRETSGIRILNQLGYDGKQVLDPVCLLSPKQWLSFAGDEPLVCGNYLLVYNLFPGNEALNNVVCKVAEKESLRIIAINDTAKFASADSNISNAGPIEFVNLIAYSQYVICDSFHGTVFSVLFHKPFEVYYNNINSSRIFDFLVTLGLQNRYNPLKPMNGQLVEWESVQEKLTSQIESSRDFLRYHLKHTDE